MLSSLLWVTLVVSGYLPKGPPVPHTNTQRHLCQCAQPLHTKHTDTHQTRGLAETHLCVKFVVQCDSRKEEEEEDIVTPDK